MAVVVKMESGMWLGTRAQVGQSGTSIDNTLCHHRA